MLFSAVGPHPVPSTPQQPKEAGCELWSRKKLQNTVGLPRQNQWGKNVLLRRKSLCILAAPAPSSMQQSRVGWLQDKMDRMHSWTSSHHAAGSILNASQP